LLGIYSELGSPANLESPARFNPIAWDATTLAGIRGAALVLGLVLLVLATAGAGLRLFAGRIVGFKGNEVASASTALTQVSAAGSVA
jgi:hypothetical protein